jgi:hypothetical protein
MDQWFLLKVGENTIYGPAPLGQLHNWATEAKISPQDRVSNDGRKTWRRAPLVAELQMDWLVEMPDNFLYGPTSVGTLQEFLATGEIDENVRVINTLDGTHSRIKDLPFFQASPQRVRGPQEVAVANPSDAPSALSDSGPGLRQRCLWLEKQVVDLQRENGRWQEEALRLRQQFIEATGREPR